MPDNIATVAAGDQQRLRDWAQAYMNARSAVYVANTGFGYGDTTVIDLSERLMDHFASTLNSGGTIGEQWVRALHQYYGEPSNYDVIDEKVMVEANMYGLPFYDFGPTAPPSPALPPTVPGGSDSVQLPTIAANVQATDAGGGRSLFVDQAHPDGTRYSDGGVDYTAGVLSVFYRPAQPTVSRDVTINDPNKVAHGAWISGLSTHTIPNVKPVKPFPLVFADTDRPVKDYPNIFFPANVVTVNRDAFFGKEHDTAVVNLGKFFPNATGDLGTEQVVDTIGLQIGYSDSADVIAPLITQVGAVKVGDGFNAFVRTDATGVARVAVLWAPPGSGSWTVTPLSNTGGGLWTAHIVSSAPSITLDAEAEDVAHNVGYSFNKAVHFQSFADSGGPTITLDRPLPNALFTLNDQVASSFRCSDPGGVQSCVGRSDSGADAPSGAPIDTSSLGAHTFTVTATDLAGNTDDEDDHVLRRRDLRLQAAGRQPADRERRERRQHHAGEVVAQGCSRQLRPKPRLGDVGLVDGDQVRCRGERSGSRHGPGGSRGPEVRPDRRAVRLQLADAEVLEGHLPEAVRRPRRERRAALRGLQVQVTHAGLLAQASRRSTAWASSRALSRNGSA